MEVIVATNPDDALYQGLYELKTFGEEESSRNGPVVVMGSPVTTYFVNGFSRVSFCPARDANPFFHLFEALWMLAGRNDVAYPAYYAANLASYSDDGKTLHAAYGHRWREHFGYDQIEWVVDQLKADPTTRRCVIAMWDPGSVDEQGDAVERTQDLYFAGHGGKDIPCNTHVYFMKRGDELTMTVCNRSNDIVLGAYGANVVHMSVLHEVVAHCVGLKRGPYWQVSNNYHAYTESPVVQRLAQRQPFERPVTTSLPLMTPAEDYTSFTTACELFVDGALSTGSPFIDAIAVPMRTAHKMHKLGNTREGADYLAHHNALVNNEWLLAATMWLKRRVK